MTVATSSGVKVVFAYLCDCLCAPLRRRDLNAKFAKDFAQVRKVKTTTAALLDLRKFRRSTNGSSLQSVVERTSRSQHPGFVGYG